jgi:hypothetical protein
LVYYSNSQIKKLQLKASSKLCVFLTSSFAWFEFIAQQASLVYNKLNCTIQLRLQGQMIEFRVKRKFFNHVPALTCKSWGGDLYPDIRSGKRTKFSLWKRR